MEQIQETQNKQEEEKPDCVKSYRISKQKFNLQLQANEELEEVIPLDNYKLFLYSETEKQGHIKIMDLKNKGKILNENPIIVEGDAEESFLIRQPFVYDQDCVCYLNTQKQKLEWFNTSTLQFECKFNAMIPTQEAMSQQDREDQAKLDDLYRDGTQIKYLKNSQNIVLMEVKMSYIQNLNDIVLTVFHQDFEDFRYQRVFQQQNQKMMYLNILNNEDCIASWGQVFNDQPIEFYFWKIDQDVKKVQLQDNIDGNVLEYQPWDKDSISIFTNINTGDYPSLKIVKLDDIIQNDKVEEENIDMNIFGQGEQNQWCMTDFYLCDYEQQKVLWERKSEIGTFVDVYNPHFRQCTFSQQVEDCDGDEDEDEFTPEDLDKVISPSAKYFIGYNNDIPEVDGEEFKNIPIVLNSIVSVGASLMHTLQKSSLYETLGENFCQEIIDLLLRKQE